MARTILHLLCIALAVLVAQAAADCSPYTAKLFPAGVICNVALPSTALPSNASFVNASLFLIDIAHARNAPVLYNNGDLSSVSYTSGLGLIGVIGANVSLVGLTASSLTDISTDWSKSVVPIPGTTYGLSSFKPDMSSAALAFTVNSIDANGTVFLSVGVFESIFESGCTGSNLRLQVGSSSQVLVMANKTSDCAFVSQTANDHGTITQPWPSWMIATVAVAAAVVLILIIVVVVLSVKYRQLTGSSSGENQSLIGRH